MNSITHTINGLASSLFLNIGLKNVAQKLDPLSKSKSCVVTAKMDSAAYTYPCNFTARKGL